MIKNTHKVQTKRKLKLKLKHNHNHILWALLNVAIWHDRFFR